VSDSDSRAAAAGGASGRMVQKKLRSGAARGRGGTKAAARGRGGAKAAAARRKGTGRGALRGGASAALSVEQCVMAASGGDAASGLAGVQAETSSAAWQRDVSRFGP
jgi:hypothetical protein